MAISFDIALDACIALVMQGASVDDCVAKFPEHAEELRAHLLVFASAADSAYVPVSADAKARGRERLLAERASLEGRALLEGRRPARGSASSGTGGGSPYRWFPESWQYPFPRMATAAVAVLILVVAGTGTVAASRGSLPGDTFYPVKLASERVQLAIEFSERDQAELHLAFAEKRARELSTLLARGGVDGVAETTSRLSSQLEAAVELKPQISSEGLDRVQAQLSASSASVLAGLQMALGAEGESGQRAEQAFESIGAAYARALEKLSPSGSVPVAAAAAQGIVQLRATDPPPEGVDQVLITIPRIEVYLAGAGQRWVTVIDAPIVLDLRQAAELPRYLGEAAVPTGTYTRIRVHVTEAIVLAGGVAHQAGLTGTSFELSRPFIVQPDETTVVVLDFDGLDTVRISTQGSFVVQPHVRVLASEPGVTPVVPERPRGPRPPTPAAAIPSTTVAPTARSATAELRGVVEAAGANFITVQGKRIELSPQSEGKMPHAVPARGAEVRVEVEVGESGQFRAIEIEVLKTPQATGREGSPTAVPSPTPAGVTGTPAEFTGIIGSVAGNRWIVGGRPVHVDKETRVSGEATVGDVAQVIGVLGQDGTIRASVIVIRAEPKPTLTPAPSAPPTTVPTPPLPTPVGATRSERPADRPTATAKPDKGPESARVVEIKGTIESLQGGTWRVDGRDVRITAGTIVIGIPDIGAEAQIVGSEQADGSVLAVTANVKVKSKAPVPFRLVGTPTSVAPTATPTQSPTATLVPNATVTPTPEPGPQTVSFEGTITLISSSGQKVNAITVGGKEVKITGATSVSGLLVLNAIVEVEGKQQLDGTVIAISVNVK